MATTFEAPSHDALLAEQAEVQVGKFQGRLLEGYNYSIFPGQFWLEPRSSAVTDFMRSPLKKDELVSLESVLENLYEAKQGQPVKWVDMGGGRALPMRQVASKPESKGKFKMTNVDLINFGLYGVKPDETKYLEELNPGMTSKQANPHFIEANMETVTLPEPADIITCIEAIQYLNDPLAAIANWYDQLADNGILVISAERDWASWICYQAEPGKSDRSQMPTKHLLDELSSEGVNFAASDESDYENGHRPKLDPNRFSNLVIQKKPGTQLRVNVGVAKVEPNLHNFKTVFYEKPVDESSPIVEVVPT
jgi:hypothetical protein